MPELPEVETTRRGIMPHVENRTIKTIDARCIKMRAPLDQAAFNTLRGAVITDICRRGKHLILKTNKENKALHLHLGMSGSLRVSPADEPPKKHDHVIISLQETNQQIRLHDPRKFGGCAVIDLHNLPPALENLGLEPLDDDFSSQALMEMIKNRRTPIKTLIMNQKFVVGVGNIYATEALFHSQIHPKRAAGTLSAQECERLVLAIKIVLECAIIQGGTTLRDFTSPDGKNGYFVQSLNIYGKSGEPCPQCGTKIVSEVIGGRTTAFCAQCQK